MKDPMKECIRKVTEGRDLDPEEARAAMRHLMDDGASPAQIAALLVGLRMKGETVDEIAAFASVLRERARTPAGLGDDLFDLCGTGGDGSGSINVSTLAALVVASEGVRVAKHGNRSVSSRCGSADLLEALGVRLEVNDEVLRRCLDEAGICFLFAPARHPAMARAAGPRRELGVRTIFNLLGPLTNPARVRRQLVGVFGAAWTRPLAEVLGRLGAQRVMVVHGAGGLDEVSLSGSTEVAELVEGRVRSYEIRPEEVGLARAAPAAVRGGGVDENAEAARRILAGEPGPGADLVALNAAAALRAAGACEDLADGVARARASLASGRAAACLAALERASNRPEGA